MQHPQQTSLTASGGPAMRYEDQLLQGTKLPAIKSKHWFNNII